MYSLSCFSLSPASSPAFQFISNFCRSVRDSSFLYFYIFLFFQFNLICVSYICPVFPCKRQYWGCLPTNRDTMLCRFACIFHFSACVRASFSIFSFFLLAFLRKQDNIRRYFKYFPCYDDFVESYQRYFKCKNKCEIENRISANKSVAT